MAECPICNESISFFSTSAMGVNYRGSYYQVCSENCADVARKENSIEVEANLAALDPKSQAISAIRFVTSEAIPTLKVVSAFGTARGATVRSKHVGSDLAAGLKSIVGGELKGYTELLAEGREEAIYRMKADAHEMGANAIVMTRFTTSMIADGAVEVMAYGTAVVVEGQETE
jgi:uncharacterized protein YbjQ (UPF0145 family)